MSIDDKMCIQISSSKEETRQGPAYQYKSSYDPMLGQIKGVECGENLPLILIEAIELLYAHNKDKKPVDVALLGPFPEGYLQKIKTMFEIYSKAEGVNVTYPNKVSETTFIR